MLERWFETGPDTEFKEVSNGAAFLIRKIIINLALIERIEFEPSAAFGRNRLQANLFRAGEEHPAYTLDEEDSRRLGRLLRDASPFVPEVRYRAANPLTEMLQRAEETPSRVVEDSDDED